MKLTKRDAETIGKTIAHLLENERFHEAAGTLEHAIDAANRNQFDYEHYSHPGEIPLGALEISRFMLNRLEESHVRTIGDAERLGDKLLEVEDFGQKSLNELRQAIQDERQRYLKWRATGKKPVMQRFDVRQLTPISEPSLRVMRKGLKYLLQANRGTLKRIKNRASVDAISEESIAAESALNLVDIYLKKTT